MRDAVLEVVQSHREGTSTPVKVEMDGPIPTTDDNTPQAASHSSNDSISVDPHNTILPPPGTELTEEQEANGEASWPPMEAAPDTDDDIAMR